MICARARKAGRFSGEHGEEGGLMIRRVMCMSLLVGLEASRGVWSRWRWLLGWQGAGALARNIKAHVPVCGGVRVYYVVAA